jgi:predicted porin
VTLSGNLDFAVGNATGTTSVKGSSVSTRDFASTTSVINIVAVEDLGGGMKATVKYGLDPRVLANNNNAQGEVMTNTFGRDELFVGIEGGFGNLKLGSPNAIGLTSFLGASVLGTGVGSGYAPSTNQVTHAYSQIRYDRSARYDSPNFNGFTVSALYAPGNDQATTSTQIPNNRKTTELGISYANGPLSLSYVNIALAAQTNAPVAAALTGTAGPKASVNILNGSYKLGNTTLVAGWNDGDAKLAASATTVTATKGYRVGVRQDIGAVALMAQYTEQKSGTGASEVKAKVTGVRADYSLSKTAAVYAAYEQYDTGVAAAATPTATTGKRDITSVGLRKSF